MAGWVGLGLVAVPARPRRPGCWSAFQPAPGNTLPYWPCWRLRRRSSSSIAPVGDARGEAAVVAWSVAARRDLAIEKEGSDAARRRDEQAEGGEGGGREGMAGWGRTAGKRTTRSRGHLQVGPAFHV
ncbi:hypothetical protein SETIT_2G426100v2 [Setaria italica]|uniref:Uncharacterized protein n=1 Tax=Setaria italica TaxID=4555 RepID=A0A368Q8V4_SETIT|nr:hypothetical protein SETIT_2G426100v2 [Setaria italica]